MSNSSSMPCPSCGSELAVYPQTPTAEHPCPFCGYVGFAALPTAIRQWCIKRLVTVSDVDGARVAADELIQYMVEQGYDNRMRFSARLEFEEALVVKFRREHGG